MTSHGKSPSLRRRPSLSPGTAMTIPWTRKGVVSMPSVQPWYGTTTSLLLVEAIASIVSCLEWLNLLQEEEAMLVATVESLTQLHE
uniref:Uncharacterized protein n=1 Tax=Leersia perrieri TaxID=77586 RepID=A0A0D9XZM8_9ORYZ